MAGGALLFDLGPLSCECTDHTLDTLYKALADPPGADSALWAPSADPWIRQHLETVTRRGLAILGRIRADVLAVTGGEAPALGRGGILGKALGWTRWTDKEFETIRRRLSGRTPDEYSLDDWMMLVDYIIHQYLPTDVIREEAEYLAVRAQLAGKVSAAIHARDTRPQDAKIAGLVAALPVRVGRIPFDLSSIEQRVLDFARARAAELIRDLGDRARHRINHIVLQHEQGRRMNSPDATLWSLQSKLQDEFAVLNRDWRRVAVTETARDANEGFIAAQMPGTRVKRVEAYAGACAFCRKIHGREFTVVDPGKPDKNGATEVWVGKSNVDRSASPRKRVGDQLVERAPSEMWWPAAGVQHPNCRGSWSLVTPKPDDVSDEFSSWLDGALKRA